MIKVKKPELKENKIHLENEDKPIVEPLMKVSEDFHGGDEITQSVNDQRFALQDGTETQEREQNEEQEGQEQSKTEEQKEENQNAKKQEQEQTGEEGQKENEEGEEQEKENEEGEQKQSTKNGEEQTGEQEQNEENEEQGEQEGQNKTQKEQNKENGEEENEEGKEYKEESEQEKENEEGEEYEENSKQAFELKKETIQHLHLELYRLIEYMSDEEKVLTPEPVSATQALNIKKLLFHQFEKKPLNSYYYYRERSEIILILDNSGSMAWLQKELETFFVVALKRKDVQVYIAPNGLIEKMYDQKVKRFVEIDHETAMKKIIQSGLPIIYVGDYDGANTPVELSWRSRVFWLCTETRYKYFEQHSWVDYREEDFRGFFGRAWDISEIIKVLKEFSKHIQQQKFWLDLHENDIEVDED